MILLILAAVIVAALLQIVLAPLTILGIMPLVSVLVVAWISYKLGAALALPLMAIAGVLMSFFVSNPALIIAAYLVSGLVLTGAVALTHDEESTSVIGSIIAVSVATLALILVTDGLGFDALSFVQTFTYLLLSVLATVAVWWAMLMVARPNK